MHGVQPWLAKVMAKLPEDKKDEFKEKSSVGMKHVMGKLKELQLYAPTPCTLCHAAWTALVDICACVLC